MNSGWSILKFSRGLWPKYSAGLIETRDKQQRVMSCAKNHHDFTCRNSPVAFVFTWVDGLATNSRRHHHVFSQVWWDEDVFYVLQQITDLSARRPDAPVHDGTAWQPSSWMTRFRSCKNVSNQRKCNFSFFCLIISWKSAKYWGSRWRSGRYEPSPLISC